jgi:ubiquinone/menaquinone biosynthesis C-methylase UbiE
MKTIEADGLLLREYGRMAATYDRYSITSAAVVWKEICPLLPKIRGKRALDLCCGTGAHTVRLARAVGPAGSVVGIDAAKGMIDFARHRRSESGRNNLKFERMDSRSLRYPADSFDFVLSTFGVANLSPEQALGEVFRVLGKDGSFLYVSWGDPNRESKVFREALTELRNRHPSLADVRRLALARRVISNPSANRPRGREPTLMSKLRSVGFRHIRRVVRPVTVRFRDPAAYVRYKATWGEYDRDLSRLSRSEREKFVTDVGHRMGWSRGGRRPAVTWNLSFTTAKKS